MQKSIVQKAPPNLIGQPNVSFRKQDFDGTIFNKGYTVIIEKAIKCPCQTKNGSPLPNCQNCHGRGWVFIDPIETRALITSINTTTKYKDWSLELLGTVSVTIPDEDRFSYMDRITLKNKTSIKYVIRFSEVLYIRDNGLGGKFVFLSYKPVTIKKVYIFDSVSTPLTLLANTDYTINTNNGYVLDFSYVFPAGFNGSVSIMYEHELQYHVLDIPHDIRASYKMNSDGKDEQVVLPVNAIARRAHNVFEVTNYDDSGLVIN